jgi:hypothetical protein
MPPNSEVSPMAALNLRFLCPTTPTLNKLSCASLLNKSRILYLKLSIPNAKFHYSKNLVCGPSTNASRHSNRSNFNAVSEHPSRPSSPKRINQYQYQPAMTWTHPDMFRCSTSNYTKAQEEGRKAMNEAKESEEWLAVGI